MPGFNGTGPRGVGPGSGWGQGPCGAGQKRRFFGRGLNRGFGRGFGRFFSWNYNSNVSKGDQLSELQEEEKYMEEEMKNIKEEINNLKSKK